MGTITTYLQEWDQLGWECIQHLLSSVYKDKPIYIYI